MLYAGSALLWISVLSRARLSYAYPLLGLNYALVVAISAWGGNRSRPQTIHRRSWISMPPTVVYLIRHAETTWNAEGRLQGTLDAPLSERGQRQVRHLVEALRDIPLAALYSSPLQRAQATARELSAAHDLPLLLIDDLREMDQGAWEGRLVDDVAAADAELLQAWRDSPADVRLPGGESLRDVQARAVRAFTALVRRHDGETIAAVAHGGVNRTILLALLGAPLGDFRQIRQGNACINVVEVDEVQSRVLVLNNTRHLGPDA